MWVSRSKLYRNLAIWAAVAVLIGLWSVDGQANTKIAPAAAEPGHPFTIIDTKSRRLTEDSVAVFRMQAFAFEIPLKTHKPFNTARARLADAMYNGVYDVFVRQNDGSEFALGGFVVHGGVDAPDNVVYAFNTAVEVGSWIGQDGGTLELGDSFGSQFRLEIPADSVGVDTYFSLTEVTSAENFPPGFRVIAAVRLSPSQTRFSPSPLLTFELPSGSRTGLPTVAFVSHDDGSGLTFLPLSGSDPVSAATADSQVSILLSHFSVAGVVEASDCSGFPLPDASANAEERALTSISRIICELYDTEDGFVGDPQIYDALYDWLSNPNDGLIPRLREAAASPGSITLALLDNLIVGEANRLLLKAHEVLEGVQVERIDSLLLEPVSELVASYLVELKMVDCSTDTQVAQSELVSLNAAIIDFYVNGELQDRFLEENFNCQFEVVFYSPFQGGFVDEFVSFPYQIYQQDGLIFNGSIDDLEDTYNLVSFDIQFDTGIVISHSPEFVLSSLEFGLKTMTVQFEDSPASEVQVFWVPAMNGDYFVVGAGTASGCLDETDEGDGGGAFQAAVSNQEILLATDQSATMRFEVAGWNLTSASATVTLDNVQPNIATGTISGSLSYSYLEFDPEDMRDYPVNGGGTFGGTLTAEGNGVTTLLSYSGSSNWCSSYSGSGILEKL